MENNNALAEQTINFSEKTNFEDIPNTSINSLDPLGRIIPECEHMGLVYINPSICIGEENNYKYIKTVSDIKFGELLLIEHVLANTNAITRLAIKFNEYLFDQYHPRKTKYREMIGISSEEFDKIVDEKVSHNCFSLGENLLMTNTITKMNHSCDPSCAVYIQESYKTENVTTIFMELFAIRNIAKDTEITISYGPKTSHERDFECKCGKSLEERNKHFIVVSKLAQYLSKNNNLMIKEKIYNYLGTPLAKRILLNHYLAHNGIFVNKGCVMAYTSEGAEMINTIVNSLMQIDPAKFNDLVKEGPMNEARLSLFIWVLENKFFG